MGTAPRFSDLPVSLRKKLIELDEKLVSDPLYVSPVRYAEERRSILMTWLSLGPDSDLLDRLRQNDAIKKAFTVDGQSITWGQVYAWTKVLISYLNQLQGPETIMLMYSRSDALELYPVLFALKYLGKSFSIISPHELFTYSTQNLLVLSCPSSLEAAKIVFQQPQEHQLVIMNTAAIKNQQESEPSMDWLRFSSFEMTTDLDIPPQSTNGGIVLSSERRFLSFDLFDKQVEFTQDILCLQESDVIFSHRDPRLGPALVIAYQSALLGCTFISTAIPMLVPKFLKSPSPWCTLLSELKTTVIILSATGASVLKTTDTSINIPTLQKVIVDGPILPASTCKYLQDIFSTQQAYFATALPLFFGGLLFSIQDIKKSIQTVNRPKIRKGQVVHEDKEPISLCSIGKSPQFINLAIENSEIKVGEVICYLENRGEKTGYLGFQTDQICLLGHKDSALCFGAGMIYSIEIQELFGELKIHEHCIIPLTVPELSGLGLQTQLPILCIETFAQDYKKVATKIIEMCKQRAATNWFTIYFFDPYTLPRQEIFSRIVPSLVLSMINFLPAVHVHVDLSWIPRPKPQKITNEVNQHQIQKPCEQFNPAFCSILDYLVSNVKESPQTTAFYSIDVEKSVCVGICWQDFGNKVSCLANELESAGLVRGDVVVLHFFNSVDFIVSAYACFYLGVVIIPIYPLDLHRIDEDLPALHQICQQYHPKLVIHGDLEKNILKSAKIAKYANEVGLDLIDIAPFYQIKQDGDFKKLEFPLFEQTDAVIMANYDANMNVKYTNLTHLQVIQQAHVINESMEKSPVLVSSVRVSSGIGFFVGVVQGVFSRVPTIVMRPNNFVRNAGKIFELLGEFRVSTMYSTSIMMEYALANFSKQKKQKMLSKLQLCGMKQILIHHDLKTTMMHELLHPIYSCPEQNIPITMGMTAPQSILISLHALSKGKLEINNTKAAVEVRCAGVPVHGTTIFIESKQDVGKIKWKNEILNQETKTQDYGFIYKDNLYVLGKNYADLDGIYIPQHIEETVIESHKEVESVLFYHDVNFKLLINFKNEVSAKSSIPFICLEVYYAHGIKISEVGIVGKMKTSRLKEKQREKIIEEYRANPQKMLIN